MSRKPKKGYYVQGKFVAEGSELDLELKRELKGTDSATRTDLKRESDELQALGTELLTLRQSSMDKLGLPEKLVEAVAEAKKITNFEGKRRQMQFIGKLMRKLEESDTLGIRAALEAQNRGSAQETLSLHLAEKWRELLLLDDDAVAKWMAEFPGTDSQQLRALVRQARKDAKPERPGEAQRHGRAYRELFALIREQVAEADEEEAIAKSRSSDDEEAND